MKFSKTRQLITVSSISLLVAGLLTACSLISIDYVYVASSTGIQAFAADGQSGALRTFEPVTTSGVSSPVAMAVDSAYANLYLANQGTSSSGGTIVHYAIGLMGELTVKDTVTLSDNPVALAINTAGTYLYVASCSASATSPSLVCASAGKVTEYALSSGAIGSAASQGALNLTAFAGDILVPTGVTVLANDGADILGNAVYISAYDQSAYNPGCTPTPACTPSTANPGWVFGFTIGSGGALSASADSPYQAGVKPSAIAADPTDRFVYVTDYASNQLIGYTILGINTPNINLNFMTSGPFHTGNEPAAITIDPRGKFIYVANALDSSVSAYEITQATGNPTAAINASSSGSTTNSTDTQPVAIVVDPAIGRYVYTANELGDSISGFRLDPTAGYLAPTQSTPYSTGLKPTALVAIPHGNHATQLVTP
ncbi:MAG: beta-propeller fold lactonase family protein [Terracidiphilus sp.]|jgi:6-phosphogluconolactonase (cycloisomerase 2 family)